MADGGKGSAPRPIPDREKFESNWDKIFKKPNKEQPKEKDKNDDTAN